MEGLLLNGSKVHRVKGVYFQNLTSARYKEIIHKVMHKTFANYCSQFSGFFVQFIFYFKNCYTSAHDTVKQILLPIKGPFEI